MPVLRKRAIVQNPQPSQKSNQPNGLYIHSSPPRVLQVSSAHIKQLIRTGDVDKLEQLIFDGQGKKLVGEYSADYKTRTFLKNVPTLMTKISLLHDSVNSGRLEELQSVLDEEPADRRKKLVMAKDDAGVGLLHKAVYYDLKNIYRYLIEKFPHMISMKDAEGRTAYHYTPMCRDTVGVQKLLVNAGADSSCLDQKQHSAKYYANHVQELELPSTRKIGSNMKRGSTSSESLNFKKSNIRIWIHQRNLGNLQQVVWEGHGSRLLVEHSNNPKIKKFLEAVPHIMGLIRDVHLDVQNDQLEELKNRLEPTVPPVVLSGKDAHGLTPLHKAAGLGKQEIAEFIVSKYPRSVYITDNEGRTPLHYAALLKDDGKMMNFLLENGADESALDNKQKTAAYYKTRTSEIDAKVLTVIPDCPRTARDSFLQNFDWNMLTSTATTPVDEGKKIGKKVADAVLGNGVEKESSIEKEEKLVEEEEKPEPETNGDAEPEAEPEAEVEPEVEPESEPQEEEKTEDTNEHEENDETNQPEINGENNEDEPQNDNETTEDNREDDNQAEEEVEAQNEEEQTPEINNNASRPESQLKSRPGSEMMEEAINQIDQAVEETSSSPGPEMESEGVIEGVVNGENEIETLNQEGQDKTEEDDEEIQSLVENGNMEQLASLVLNGEGDRLVGKKSENYEIQSFLDNVSVYMNKINRIHMASRNGSLRDLQAALDRRKFAIARDKISPNGATPLHTAVVFGNTSVVRYLAGRFPETVQVADDNERTPLHYSAVLSDNGHYYNLLVHLGADNRAVDKFGRTADYYKTNRNEFSHKTLLRDFGVEESASEEILSDKVPDDLYSARKDLDDEDMLNVLERCYNVLHGRRSSNAISATSTNTTMSTISNSNNNQSPTSLISKQLRRYVFDTVKIRLTKLDHNLYDLIWPSVKKLPTEMSFRIALEQDFPMGIVAPDYYCYKVFAELLEPMIKAYNSIDPHFDLNNQPDVKFVVDESENEEIIEISLDLDPHSKWILSGILDCTRNLKGFELPKSLTASQLENVERLVTTVLLSDEVAKALYPNASNDELEEKGCGVYYTMNEVLEDPSEARVVLASNGLLIPLWNIPESDRLHGKHWPYGRGVFISNGSNLAVWINVLDHIRIVTCTSSSRPGNIGQVYSRVHRLMAVLGKRLDFQRDEKLGFLSARPSSIGNTLQFNFTLRFPNLIKEPDNLRHLCQVRGLNFHRNAGTSDVVRIGNQQSLGVTEIQSFEDFTTAVMNILQLEKDLAMSNSLHIAAMFVNIFRKKKQNLATELD